MVNPQNEPGRRALAAAQAAMPRSRRMARTASGVLLSGMLALSCAPTLAYADNKEGSAETPATNIGSANPEAGTANGKADGSATKYNAYADGVFTGTATVNPDDDEDFEAYEIQVAVTIANGAISGITVSGAEGEDVSYNDKAVGGTRKKPGVAAQLTALDSLSADAVDGVSTVSGATCSSVAIKSAVKQALAVSAAQAEAERAAGEPSAAVELHDAAVTIDESEYAIKWATAEFEGAVQAGQTGVWYRVDLAEGQADLSDVQLAGYREMAMGEFYQLVSPGSGEIDVVSTATKRKAANFANAVSSETESGTDISGTSVPVSVAASDALAAAAVNAAAEQGVVAASDAAQAIGALKRLSATVPAALYGAANLESGVQLSAPSAATTAKADATISSSSRWGNYEVVVDGISSDITTQSVIGMTFADETGAVYTLGYLENIWFRLGEFSFVVDESFSMPHMPTPVKNISQFSGIQGHTITNVTYYTTNGTYAYDLTDSNLKVAKQLSEDMTVSAPERVKMVEGQDLTIQVELSDAAKAVYGQAEPSIRVSQGRRSAAIEGATFDSATGTLTIPQSAYSTFFSNDSTTSVSVQLTFPETAGYVQKQLSIAVDRYNQTSVTVDDASYTILWDSKEFSGATQIGETGIWHRVSLGRGQSDLAGTQIVGYHDLSMNDFYQLVSPGSGEIDVVSTATKRKAANFANAVSAETESGTDISGTSVPVTLDASDAFAAAVLKAASEDESVDIALSDDAQAVAGLDRLSATLPAATYGTASLESGVVLSAPVEATRSEASATISTSSRWGNYQIDVDGISEDITTQSVLGMTFATDGGKTYTLGYLENIWFRLGEFSFVVDESFSMPHMPTPVSNISQFSDIQGQTITSVTYYTTNGTFTYDLTASNLFVQRQASEEMTIELPAEAEMVEGKDVVIPVSISDAAKAKGYGDNGVSVARSAFRSSVAIEGAAYDAEAGELTIPASAFETLFPEKQSGNQGGPGPRRAPAAPAAGEDASGDSSAAATSERETSASLSVTFVSSGDYAPISSSLALKRAEAQPEADPVQLDTAALDGLVAQAETLKASDYTVESWQRLQDAIAVAVQALSAEGVTQEQIDAQAAALTAALDDLAKASAIDPDAGSQSDPGDGSGDDPAASTGESAAAGMEQGAGATDGSVGQGAAGSTANATPKTGDPLTVAAGATGAAGLLAGLTALFARRRSRN